jgi:hypothetical protein
MKFTHTKPIKEVKMFNTKTKKSHKLLYVKIFITIIILLCSGYGIYSFLTSYRFRTPILLQSPIVKIKPNILINPISKGKVTEAIIDIGEIVDKIYTLESSDGKNDSCNKIGKFNGYGYRQNTSEWICYNSHEEVRELVINWVLSHLKTMSIEQAMCHYNQGTVSDSCTYAVNYRSL